MNNFYRTNFKVILNNFLNENDYTDLKEEYKTRRSYYKDIKIEEYDFLQKVDRTISWFSWNLGYTFSDEEIEDIITEYNIEYKWKDYKEQTDLIYLDELMRK